MLKFTKYMLKFTKFMKFTKLSGLELIVFTNLNLDSYL